jgi:pumilio family protein 6
MKTLAVHAVGASVVEFMFLNLPARQTASLKQEFYGPHFSLFGVVKQGKNTSAVPTLKSNIESATTDTQKKSAIDFVQKILNKGMTKNFYGFTYFQQLFAEYIDVVEPSEIRAVSSTIADHSIHLLSTRVGTRVVAACASYGTPKDRKRICKSLKGYTSSSLLHRDAYLALLRLIQVTDDTVSIQKSVLNEILTKPKDGDLDNSLLELALSDTGSKLFLMLLVKDVEARMKYFDPYERSILEQIPTMKDNGKEVPTSKKDPEIRRNELLKHINDPLIEICIGNVQELLTSLPGSRVMKEVYTSFPSERLANAIVDACETSLTDAKADKRNEEEKSAHFSLFEDPIGHRSIKSLILCDADSSSKPCVSKILLDRLGNRIPDISGSNRGAFVAAALFKVQPLKVTAKTMFNPHNKYIKAKSKAKGSNAGYIALLKEMDSN